MQKIDYRNEFIHRSVPGKTFADVGGLWNTVNEKISVGLAAGASHATMIDVQKPDDVWWEKFHERMKDKGISEYGSVSADLTTIDRDHEGLAFDVVHCSGVLYHHYDPPRLIHNLSRMTNERLILQSFIVPTHIENDAGRFDFPDSGALFVPALSEAERLVLARYFAENVGSGTAVGISTPFNYDGPHRYGPYWWMFTRHSLVTLINSIGLKVIDHQLNAPHSLVALIEK